MSLPNGPQEGISPRGANIVQYGGPGGSGRKDGLKSRQLANGVLMSSPRSATGLPAASVDEEKSYTMQNDSMYKKIHDQSQGE